MFIKHFRNEIAESSKSTTENGAVGYSTTGKALLDCNFSVSSMRKMNEKEIINMFMKAYYENPTLAVQWLFYISDVRYGLGERRTFKIIMSYISRRFEDIALKVIRFIPEYNRWDSLIDLIDCGNDNVVNEVIKIISEQIISDVDNMLKGNQISLISKWLPSENSSSYDTKRKARIIMKKLGYTPREYRKKLSALRKYLDVVECKMSSNKWGDIDYSAVPSRANLNYSKAFLRNDYERRKEFLDNLTIGKTKINADTLFPHDIVHKYIDNIIDYDVKDYDETLEQLWKNLKHTDDIENTIVVADGSFSMTTPIDTKSDIGAIEVANALAIYCGERCSGEFKDKFITFSNRPQLVDFSYATSLRDKIDIVLHYDEISNTNIEKVFDLILDTAVKNNMSQNDIPKNILIISDMEFDTAQDYYSRADETLFDIISQKYSKYGYNLPKLIFWNVNSRTKTIPVRENDNGVILVSGFSVNTLKMVMNNRLDPYEALTDILNSERYEPIKTALNM